MGLTARTRNEVQFVELLQRTRALEDDSWRKPHYYEHLKKLHAQLSESAVHSRQCEGVFPPQHFENISVGSAQSAAKLCIFVLSDTFEILHVQLVDMLSLLLLFAPLL
jgi:hypothetical protein